MVAGVNSRRPTGSLRPRAARTQAVGGEQVWSLDLAAEDSDLMPEG